MTLEEIRKNAPEGATHYADDNKGFDYLLIGDDRSLAVWNDRFMTWLPVGYVKSNHKYKPL
ncbi:hypothetical protein [Acinetobacter sp. HR7]|uniref:hypothetical protein n=1 Tax=Acinetobacter sp. HR7 TaxID=1509403 RepID=UPI000557051F|nr:hypothetical protein [Acinetobacter sp. HR7]